MQPKGHKQGIQHIMRLICYFIAASAIMISSFVNNTNAATLIDVTKTELKLEGLANDIFSNPRFENWFPKVAVMPLTQKDVSRQISNLPSFNRALERSVMHGGRLSGNRFFARASLPQATREILSGSYGNERHLYKALKRESNIELLVIPEVSVQPNGLAVALKAVYVYNAEMVAVTRSVNLDTGQNTTRLQTGMMQPISQGPSTYKLQKWLKSDCRTIRSMASFAISSRCAFTVQDVETFSKNGVSGVVGRVYSKGMFYDIYFTVVYATKGNRRVLATVENGEFAGVSKVAQRAWEEIAQELQN